jgi:hypothetical protein
MKAVCKDGGQLYRTISEDLCCTFGANKHLRLEEVLRQDGYHTEHTTHLQTSTFVLKTSCGRKAITLNTPRTFKQARSS